MCSSAGISTPGAREQRRVVGVEEPRTVTSARAPLRETMYAASAPRNRVLIGTSTPPAVVVGERGDDPLERVRRPTPRPGRRGSMPDADERLRDVVDQAPERLRR